MGFTVSTLGFGIPWKIVTPEEGEAITYDNFLYQASFTYQGSAENLPIENIAIRFPCPNVENKTAGVMLSTWMLYWQDEENMLHAQMWGTNGEILGFYGYRGERTENLEILLTGIEPTIDGPKIYYRIDKLYPREVFWMTSSVEVPKENAKRVTLRDYGDNEGRSSSSFYKHPSGPFDFSINTSFWVQLSMKVDNTYEKIETFSRDIDNLTWATAWLYPS